MQFKSIQVARALAANCVLLSHLLIIEKKYGHGIILLPDSVSWGASGVDLFFVVSGFIMAMIAAREEARTFVMSRLTRIYPTYWFYSLAVMCVTCFHTGMSSFVFSPMDSVFSCFHTDASRNRLIVYLHMLFRAFTRSFSCFHTNVGRNR